MYEQWISLKEQIKKLTEELHEVEANIWIKANEMGAINPTGSKTFDVDGFKVTISHKDNISVDQTMAANYPYLFKPKYEFSKTLYKTLMKQEQTIVDEIITIKPAKPGFSVERV